MWDVPFAYRLAALFLFLGGVSGVEFALRGASAVRWRAALLILSLGAAGALAGAAIDSLTSAISPAYFAVGKELGWTSDLAWRARVLGLQAGCSAGVVVGAVLASVNHRAAGPSLPLARMWRLGTVPLMTAAVGGLVFGAFGAVAPPAVLVDAVRSTVPEGDERAFVLVWCTHAGLYAGAAVGLVVAAVRAWRARRVLSSKSG